MGSFIPDCPLIPSTMYLGSPYCRDNVIKVGIYSTPPIGVGTYRYTLAAIVHTVRFIS
jgi:hypothetical protein